MSSRPFSDLATLILLLFISIQLAPWAAALPLLSLTCKLDKSIYGSSDTVIVSGRVSSNQQPVPASILAATFQGANPSPSQTPLAIYSSMARTNGNFTVQFSLNNAADGNYTVIVSASRRGYQNGKCQTGFAVGIAPFFSLSISPTSVAISRGQSANFTIFLSSTTGYPGPITMSAQSPPETMSSFSPAQLAPNGRSQLTITTNPQTPLGNYSITITAHGGTTSQAVAVHLTVIAPFDFVVGPITPSAVAVTEGSAATFSVPVKMWGSPAQTVHLTLLAGPPASTVSFSPANVNTNYTSILTITTSSATPAETYLFTVSASMTANTHSASGSLTVLTASPFNVQTSPNSIVITEGLAATYTLTVLAGTVPIQNVAVYASTDITGATVQVSPTSGTPPFTSTVTVETTGATQAGSYAVLITASGGEAIKAVATVLILTSPASTNGPMEITSNSTITDLTVNDGTITFIAGGPAGTSGTCTATVPTTFFKNGPRILVNGQPPGTQPQITHNSTYYVVQFTYEHPSLTAITPIPEFSDLLFAEMTGLALLALLVCRKQERRRGRGRTVRS